MNIKEIVEGMTAPQVAQVIKDNFNEVDKDKANKTDLNKSISDLASVVEANKTDLTKKIDNNKEDTDEKLSELGSEVQTISHTETINPSAWYVYFPNVTIEKGERFRIKITSDNPITRMILGASDARILDTSDTTILQSNEWIERTSAATRTGIGVYVSTENGSSANLQVEIQKGLALLEEDVTTLETNLDKLYSDYNGYNAERVVRNGAWDPLFTSLPLSKGEKFRMRINTQSTFTRLILGSIEKRIYDSDAKGIPSNDTWINLSSNYDLSSVGIYMVFSDGIAANVKVEIQKGVGALSGEVDEIRTEIVEIKNDISLLPNVEDIVAENLGEFRQSAETSVQNGKLLTGLHIKTGEIFRVKVNASSQDWSRVFLYYNNDVAYANRLWDSDGTDRTNTWVSFEAKADIYSLGLYIVSTGAVFSIELEKQGLINDIANSDVLWGKKWAVCGDSFTDGATYTLVQEGKYVGKRYVYPYLIGSRCNMEILDFFDGGKTLAYPASGGFENSLTAPSQPYYYQNIPEDVDYITIYLGINDSHHNYGSSGSDGEDVTGYIPLGTIEDNTTASYYGAWNVVLSWLIENRPFAHIGIIVSNGCDSDSYRIAQIEVAKKYGIPYIDLNGDERTPAMIRSTNPNIAASVKESRLRTQSVSETNSHPNDAAHLFESTFIENFLRSL